MRAAFGEATSSAQREEVAIVRESRRWLTARRRAATNETGEPKKLAKIQV